MTERTAASDTVTRIALGMWAADTRAVITAAQRAWVVERLCRHIPGTTMAVPFSDEERAKLKEPLCTYIKEFHPRIAAIVARQFEEDRDDVASGGIRPTTPDAVPLSPVWRGGVAPHLEP